MTSANQVKKYFISQTQGRIPRPSSLPTGRRPGHRGAMIASSQGIYALVRFPQAASSRERRLPARPWLHDKCTTI